MENVFVKKAKILEKEIFKIGIFLHRRFEAGSRQKQLKAKRDLALREDFESEEKICQVIARLFPDDSIFGEERGLKKGRSEYVWVVDPLCGTNNYAFGAPFYGISVARTRENDFLYGLIHIPETGDILNAEKGRGAFLNGKRVALKKRNTLGSSLVLYGNQFAGQSKMKKDFFRIAPKAFAMRITGSAAYDAVLVASGRAQARILHNPKLVDIAAAIVIIKEAGGVVADFNGNTAYSGSGGIVLSENSAIQTALTRLL